MSEPQFSEPDPAGYKLAPSSGAVLNMIDDSVTCENCTHYGVCAVVAGLRPMLANWQAGDPEDEPPVDPTNLAVICGSFDPVE